MAWSSVAARAWRAIASTSSTRNSALSARRVRDLALLARGLLSRPAEHRRIERHADSSRLVVFIVGAPRSGSTLLAQVAARCFDTAYASNFVARHWLAPVLAWERFARSRTLDRLRIPLSSRFGATEGAESPHEFGFFWRTWLGLERSDCLTREEADRAGWSELRAECEALAGWFAAPLVLKNLNATSYQIERLAREIPQSRFLHVVRDRERTIASILGARRTIHGSERAWWSIRPEDWRAWSGLEPREQVARQVDDVRAAIDAAFATLPEDRRHVERLEEFTGEPEMALARMARILETEPRTERFPAGGIRSGG